MAKGRALLYVSFVKQGERLARGSVKLLYVTSVMCFANLVFWGKFVYACTKRPPHLHATPDLFQYFSNLALYFIH